MGIGKLLVRALLSAIYVGCVFRVSSRYRKQALLDAMLPDSAYVAVDCTAD